MESKEKFNQTVTSGSISRKTIAEHMKDVLIDNNTGGVMWGDCSLLDYCASRCTHTNLMEQHPLTRHKRILDALQKSKLFDTKFITLNGMRGNNTVRTCKLKNIDITMKQVILRGSGTRGTK